MQILTKVIFHNVFITFCEATAKVNNPRIKPVQPCYNIAKCIAFGAVGGFAGGLGMVSLLPVLTVSTADTIPEAMLFALGASQNNAIMMGLGLHILAGILIGMIFGAVTAAFSKLRIASFKKGISEGLITGRLLPW